MGRQRAEASALPEWLKPQLTKLVEAPPDGSEWLHEVKFDGYRMHAQLDRGAGPAADSHRARLNPEIFSCSHSGPSGSASSASDRWELANGACGLVAVFSECADRR